MLTYDVAVIGSGLAGADIAKGVVDGGKKAVIIENDLWGGTCPNKGCDPKKILLSGLEVVERNNQLAGKGFQPIKAINWSDLMDFKNELVDPFPGNFKKELQDYGVDTIEGSPRFVGKNRVEINGEMLESEIFVIATGQHPIVLDIEGKEYLKTSNDFLDAKELPKSMAFIGGGYIAFELAAIANAAGSEVTIIQHNSTVLKGFDSDLVNDMVERYKANGIKFAFDVETKKVTKEGDLYKLEADNYSESFHYIVSTTGRKSNVENLGLDKAGVETNKAGIVVNDHLQTSNPAIYSCGDVIDKKALRLTPVSTFEAAYLVDQILGNSTDEIKYPLVPSVAFGAPKLSAVGVLPEDIKDSSEYAVKELNLKDWFTYKRLNDPVAKAKLVYKDGLLVGAHVLCSQADVLINYLTLVIDKEITHEELERMIFAYPTVGSDLPELV